MADQPREKLIEENPIGGALMPCTLRSTRSTKVAHRTRWINLTMMVTRPH